MGSQPMGVKRVVVLGVDLVVGTNGFGDVGSGSVIVTAWPSG